jgi:1,2-phenylacetyl-CoA epoxidase catalytic subunit
MEDMNITDYLAKGGVITSPQHMPPRYRAEVLRIMASFVDSELAGAAGFADLINQGPGVAERIAAARIVMEKTEHAAKVLRLMGEFGTDTQRYASGHSWTDRLARDAAVGTERAHGDMRLSVFNYPLAGWTDAVVMNLLMGQAVGLHLADYARVSYQPLAEAMREISPIEARHTALAQDGVAKMAAEGQKPALQTSVDYWWPRVAVSFGSESSNRATALAAMGLRHTANAEMRQRWQTQAGDTLAALGLAAPAE